MNKNIAIVDDEEDIVALITQILKKDGYNGVSYYSGDAFQSSLLKEKPKLSLILLDVMLPGQSGIDILRTLRNHSDYENYKGVPVIMISARDTEADKVVGLEMGADDYISKPFSQRELSARVKAVMRRYDEKLSFSAPSTKIKISGLTLDENRFLAYADGGVLDLTSAEFKILLMLAKKKGWVFDRNKILDNIWSGDKFVTDRTVDVHIKHLREKMGKYGGLVKTVRGVGYKLDDEA